VQLQTDAPDLPPGGYRIEVREARVAGGQLPAGGVFATPAPDGGLRGRHPETSAPGAWIETGAGLDPQAFLIAHLVGAWRRSGPAILGVQAVADAVGRLEADQPALVRAVVPRIVTLPRLADLLQRLLAENVPVRDLGGVLEALAAQPVGGEPAEHLAQLRRGLAPLISQRAAPTGHLEAIYPDPAIEESLRAGAPLSPADAEGLKDDLEDVLHAYPRAVIVTSGDVRAALHAQVSAHFPGLMVIAIDELVPQLKIVSVGLVG
jgi:flagellar biosynthesis component FlhA